MGSKRGLILLKRGRFFTEKKCLKNKFFSVRHYPKKFVFQKNVLQTNENFFKNKFFSVRHYPKKKYWKWLKGLFFEKCVFWKKSDQIDKMWKFYPFFWGYFCVFCIFYKLAGEQKVDFLGVFFYKKKNFFFSRLYIRPGIKSRFFGCFFVFFDVVYRAIVKIEICIFFKKKCLHSACGCFLVFFGVFFIKKLCAGWTTKISNLG